VGKDTTARENRKQTTVTVIKTGSFIKTDPVVLLNNTTKQSTLKQTLEQEKNEIFRAIDNQCTAAPNRSRKKTSIGASLIQLPDSFF
jgi:hypothetical protein